MRQRGGCGRYAQHAVHMYAYMLPYRLTEHRQLCGGVRGCARACAWRKQETEQDKKRGDEREGFTTSGERVPQPRRRSSTGAVAPRKRERVLLHPEKTAGPHRPPFALLPAIPHRRQCLHNERRCIERHRARRLTSNSARYANGTPSPLLYELSASLQRGHTWCLAGSCEVPVVVVVACYLHHCLSFIRPIEEMLCCHKDREERPPATTLVSL